MADSQPRRHQPGGVLRGVEIVAVLDVVHRALHAHGEPAVRRAEVARRLVVLADEQVDVAVDRSLAAQLVGQVAGGVEVADPQQAAVQVAAHVGRHVLPGFDSAAEAVHRFAEVAGLGQVLAGADEQQGRGDLPGPRVRLLGPGGEPLRRGAALLRRAGSRVQLLDVVRGPWSAHPATVGGARGSGHRGAVGQDGGRWRGARRRGRYLQALWHAISIIRKGLLMLIPTDAWAALLESGITVRPTGPAQVELMAAEGDAVAVTTVVERRPTALAPSHVRSHLLQGSLARGALLLV